MSDIYFPPRELEVMSILWRLGSATVAEVREALDESWPTPRCSRRSRRSRRRATCDTRRTDAPTSTCAVVGAERAGGSAIARIKDAIFHGSAERMFAQFVSDRNLSREELERMRGLLAERLEEES